MAHPKVSRSPLLLSAPLGLALAAVVTAAPAWGAACPAPARNPTVRVVSQMPRPDYRHSLDRSQIGALAGHGRMTSDKSHAGLTRTDTSFTVKPILTFQRLGDGTLCASLKEVEANWRMTRLQVDIASEYRQGSCPYQEVLRHENEHVSIAQSYFTEADRGLKQDLTAFAQGMGAFVVRGSPQQAAEDAASRFMRRAENVLDRYRRGTTRDNAAIDTPENYRAVSRRCRDW
ncbi:MAG TPA: hypothetical protein VK196_02950 [Magnetospirillum sp.]|nr:hypothetical protein [Magnetospirillum sp.]